MESRRGSNAMGICGTNNTGKTVICEELIKKFNEKRDRLKSNGKKYPNNYHKLIVFDPQQRFKKYMREGDITINIGDEGWEEMLLKVRDSMVIFDDYKILAGEQTITKTLLKVFGWRMAYGLDMIFIVWHPLQFPPSMSRFLDKYLLFRINGDDKEYVSRLNGNKDKLIDCKRLLDREFLKYNENEYKNLYPKFPFIFYDTGTDKATKVNFKK